MTLHRPGNRTHDLKLNSCAWMCVEHYFLLSCGNPHVVSLPGRDRGVSRTRVNKTTRCPLLLKVRGSSRNHHSLLGCALNLRIPCKQNLFKSISFWDIDQQSIHYVKISKTWSTHKVCHTQYHVIKDSFDIIIFCWKELISLETVARLMMLLFVLSC